MTAQNFSVFCMLLLLNCVMSPGLLCRLTLNPIMMMSTVWDLGANGDKGLKFLVENVIFGIASPDLPIHDATFMGLR